MKILMILVAAVFFLVEPAVAEDCACDGEVGAGFGLCRAYCEAMDCDGIDVQASEVACGKVKANYYKITGKEFLPCECPAFDANNLQTYESGAEWWMCSASENRCVKFDITVPGFAELTGQLYYTGDLPIQDDNDLAYSGVLQAIYVGTQGFELTPNEAAACYYFLSEYIFSK